MSPPASTYSVYSAAAAHEPRPDLVDALAAAVSPTAVAWGLCLLGLAFVCYMWLVPLITGWQPYRKPGLYQSRRILTPNETEFYGRLVEALPDYVVHTQIAMSALIEPRIDRHEDGKEYMRRRASFSQKYVDFVICRPGKLEVIAIVELDDITHDEAKDAARDEMLEGAYYNVVRWHSRMKPSKAEILKTIRALDKKRKRVDKHRAPSS